MEDVLASEDDFFFFFLFLFFLPVVGDPGVNTFLKSDIFGGWFVGTVAMVRIWGIEEEDVWPRRKIRPS